MTHLKLDEEEKEVLIEVLESTLSDLRYEIADTDLHDFKERLKTKKAVLMKLLDTVKESS